MGLKILVKGEVGEGVLSPHHNIKKSYKLRLYYLSIWKPPLTEGGRVSGGVPAWKPRYQSSRAVALCGRQRKPRACSSSELPGFHVDSHGFLSNSSIWGYRHEIVLPLLTHSALEQPRPAPRMTDGTIHWSFPPWLPPTDCSTGGKRLGPRNAKQKPDCSQYSSSML